MQNFLANPAATATDATATDATATDATATDATPATPATPEAATAKPAKPRKPAKRKPAKPAATAATATVKPAKRKPATATDTTAATAITSRGLARDAATVTRSGTNFSQYSDRDTAYLVFFGSVMRTHNHSAKLAQIHDAGSDAGNGKRRNPNYTGSSKATDAGAINRLVKAGYITASADGNTLRATVKAKSTAAYNGK